MRCLCFTVFGVAIGLLLPLIGRSLCSSYILSPLHLLGCPLGPLQSELVLYSSAPTLCLAGYARKAHPLRFSLVALSFCRRRKAARGDAAFYGRIGLGSESLKGMAPPSAVRALASIRPMRNKPGSAGQIFTRHRTPAGSSGRDRSVRAKQHFGFRGRTVVCTGGPNVMLGAT